jgi:hypothetical protein
MAWHNLHKSLNACAHTSARHSFSITGLAAKVVSQISPQILLSRLCTRLPSDALDRSIVSPERASRAIKHA